MDIGLASGLAGQLVLGPVVARELLRARPT
jgi:hypothetical protein